VATGESYSVREFVEAAFGYAGLDWEPHVAFDPRYLRPTEVDVLQGDASEGAAPRLGWQPKVGFDELVRMMVDHDMELAAQERTLREAGHSVRPAARRRHERRDRIFVAGHRGLVGLRTRAAAAADRLTTCCCARAPSST
jgi:hypothetical protein